MPVEASIEHRKPRKPRARERGLGRRQAAELLEALDREELFQRRGSVYHLVASRADLAANLGVTRQALTGRLARLESRGVLLDRYPTITIDGDRLVRSGPGDRPGQTRVKTHVKTTRSREARLSGPAAARRALAGQRTRVGPRPLDGPSRDPDPWTAPPETPTPVNVCCAIKRLLETFDKLMLSMIDYLNKSNQSKELSGCCQTFTRENYQTFTHQTFTPPSADAPDTSENPPRDRLPPGERQFEPQAEAMTRESFEALVEKWTQSWDEDTAAKAAKPSVGLLFSVCRQYPQEWCHRAMRLIARDMAGSGKLRNPGGLLYTAARDGWLSYFPEEPPWRCGHCDGGVLISQAEERCAECALREREAARAAAEAAEEAARAAAEAAAAEAAEAERVRDEQVEEARQQNAELKAEFGVGRVVIIRTAHNHQRGYLLESHGENGKDYAAVARELVKDGVLQVPDPPAGDSDSDPPEVPDPPAGTAPPAEAPRPPPGPLRNWPDGPQPLGALLGDVVSRLSGASGPAAEETPAETPAGQEPVPDRPEDPDRPDG